MAVKLQNLWRDYGLSLTLATMFCEPGSPDVDGMDRVRR